MKINVIWQKSNNLWALPDLIYWVSIELVFVIIFYNLESTHIILFVHRRDKHQVFCFCFVFYFVIALKIIGSPHQHACHLWLLIFSFPVSKICYSIWAYILLTNPATYSLVFQKATFQLDYCNSLRPLICHLASQIIPPPTLFHTAAREILLKHRLDVVTNQFKHSHSLYSLLYFIYMFIFIWYIFWLFYKLE